MRLLPLLVSLLALPATITADGAGRYNNNRAKQEASYDRQNSITVATQKGVTIVSRSLTYNPATNGTKSQLDYDEVTIDAGATRAFGWLGRYSKVEISLNALNYSQAGTGRRADISLQQFDFAWRPHSIIQYVETATDANGAIVQNGYDVNDTLCTQYEIRPSKSSFTFQYLGSRLVDATNGTATVNTYAGSSADGVFQLILKATGATSDTQVGGRYRGRAVWIDGRFVSPTSIKFDVGVDVTRPAFKLNTTGACGTSYQVAIKSWARSSQFVWARTTTSKVVNGTTTNNRQITKLNRIQAGGDASPFGFFTWADTAAVNTTQSDNSTSTDSTNVIATSFRRILNGEDDDNTFKHTSEAIHSFDAIRPAKIMWDPEFGSDATDPDADEDTQSGGGTTAAPNSASSTSFTLVSFIVTIMLALIAQ